MEQRQIEEEEELMQEALALLADCQDDDYDAAISRLLLPSDDDLHSPVSANRSDAIMSTTEAAMPIPLGLAPFTSSASFSAEVSPAVTPTLTTATSSPVKKTPTSAAKQQQRKKKAPSSTGKKRKTASHNSNRARDERKEELIYLRKTVQTMEARLRTLQLSQRRALVAPAPARAVPQGEAQTFTEGAFALAALQGHAVMSEPPLSCEDMKEDAAMGPVWTEIAARQYQERRRVELENIRLKLILEGQIKMAKSLEKMLTKRTSLRVMESIQGKYLTSLQHRKPTSTEEEDEATIFARLEKELETALDEVDVVFEAIGLSRMEKTVEATSHAVWEHFVHSMDHIPSRFVYQKQLKTETTDDTLMESFGLELVGSRNATAAFRDTELHTSQAFLQLTLGILSHVEPSQQDSA
ncbi:hypothetical protein PI126_g8068 [Phytophthora idaei]|nr:hypothetical protein PI126_g8068 [Phytophthora idaei]